MNQILIIITLIGCCWFVDDPAVVTYFFYISIFCILFLILKIIMEFLQKEDSRVTTIVAVKNKTIWDSYIFINLSLLLFFLLIIKRKCIFNSNLCYLIDAFYWEGAFLSVKTFPYVWLSSNDVVYIGVLIFPTWIIDPKDS